MSKVLGNYVAVELEAEHAPEFLEALRDHLGRGGDDVQDAIRMIKNFDVFYEFMIKKFKEYLVPKKELSDLIRGNVIVDKLKLIKANDQKRVQIVFDRSVKEEEVIEVLRNLGFEIEKK